MDGGNARGNCRTGIVKVVVNIPGFDIEVAIEVVIKTNAGDGQVYREIRYRTPRA
jgi:hypothetical protein